MRKLQRAARVLRTQWGAMTVRDRLALVQHGLFKSERILVYWRPLNHGGPNTPTGHPIVKGRLDDLEHARRRMSSVPWEFQCDLYDGVKDFFVCHVNGTIAHISWVYQKHHPNRILELGDGDCEIKFCLTAPDFRGKGLYPAALTAIQHHLHDEGFRRCFICVKENNQASIRGIQKAGFSYAGVVRLRKAFGVQISRRWATRNVSRAVEATTCAV